jgi:integrase
MAIELYCTQCRTSCSLDAKKCKKCGVSFGRDTRKYRVCVSVKGQRKIRIVDNLTIARETEATIKSDMLRDEFDITVHKANKVPTLRDLWAKYLPWAKEHKKSWRDDELYYGKHIEPRFANKTLDSITAFDIEKMKAELKKATNKNGKPYAPQTIKHQVVILRRLFNLARKWGMYQGENPVSSVQIPRVNNEKTEFLTNEEAERLFKTLEEWPCRGSVALIMFALLTGLRRGEIMKLKWDDVDFERNLVVLRDPKSGKDQNASLSKEALDILCSLEATSPYVFPGDSGQQRSGFKGPWLRIRKAAGLPDGFRFHGLRHHFACTLVSNGKDLAIVKELLHHKDIRTTQRYAHLKPDAIKQAALDSAALLVPKPRHDNIVSIKRSSECPEPIPLISGSS